MPIRTRYLCVCAVCMFVVHLLFADFFVFVLFLLTTNLCACIWFGSNSNQFLSIIVIVWTNDRKSSNATIACLKSESELSSFVSCAEIFVQNTINWTSNRFWCSKSKLLMCVHVSLCRCVWWKMNWSDLSSVRRTE